MMWKTAGLGLFVLLMATAADAADLTVVINGIRNSNGAVAAGIFNSEGSFPKAQQAFGSFRLRAPPTTASFTVRNLPPGKYAVTAFHDENDNGKLDADPTGLPTEGYGVSNDARELLAPPQFAKASFDIGNQDKTITVTLGY